MVVFGDAALNEDGDGGLVYGVDIFFVDVCAASVEVLILGEFGESAIECFVGAVSEEVEMVDGYESALVDVGENFDVVWRKFESKLWG